MPTAVFTEEELRRAVAAYMDGWADVIPPEGKDHIFSARYEERKKQVIALAARMERRAGRHKVLRRIASLLVVAVFGLGIVMAANPAAYAAVRSWTLNIYNKLVDYTFGHAGEKRMYAIHEPVWLPEGYIKTDDIDSYPNRIIVYTDTVNDRSIVLSYYDMAETDMINIDHLGEDINPEEVLVKGTKCQFYPPTEDSGGGELVWVNENAGLVIVINSELSREEAVRLAESIAF